MNYDEMAIQFQDSTNDREKNKLFIELRKYWLPWIYDKMKQFNVRDREELLAIYDEKMLRSLTIWDRRARWTTYSFSWARKALSECRRIFKDKDKKYCVL